MKPVSFQAKKRIAPLSVLSASLIFFIVSLLGWCFEKIGRYLLYHSTDDRGFLSLPLCPIYGTCVILIGMLFGSPQSPAPWIARLCRPFGRQATLGGRIYRLLLYFLAVTGLATGIELIVGLVFRRFGIPLWDYSERLGNFMGVICPSFSLLWGVLLTGFMGILWDRLCASVSKIPLPVQRAVAIPIGIVVSGDFLLNCVFVFFHGERLWFL